ncbi:MAG: hypothetical protein AAGE03_07310 [Pseudomonadota bacterium]
MTRFVWIAVLGLAGCGGLFGRGDIPDPTPAPIILPPSGTFSDVPTPGQVADAAATTAANSAANAAAGAVNTATNAATNAAQAAVPSGVTDAAGQVQQAAAAVAGANAALGQETVALGDPSEGGLWLKTGLVQAETQGVVTAQNGESVPVLLRPLDGAGGAQISLQALQALGLPLTGLSPVTVSRG